MGKQSFIITLGCNSVLIQFATPNGTCPSRPGGHGRAPGASIRHSPSVCPREPSEIIPVGDTFMGRVCSPAWNTSPQAFPCSATWGPPGLHPCLQEACCGHLAWLHPRPHGGAWWGVWGQRRVGARRNWGRRGSVPSAWRSSRRVPCAPGSGIPGGAGGYPGGLSEPQATAGGDCGVSSGGGGCLGLETA